MQHVAILNKKLKLLPKVLSGEKSIESRWYVARYAPWNRIGTGDVVYFKNSGEPITAKVHVKKVLQFSNLNKSKILEILDKYGTKIGFEKKDHLAWANKMQKKNYCILIFLENPQKIEPFRINKKGFGNACAWMCAQDIEQIMLK